MSFHSLDLNGWLERIRFLRTRHAGTYAENEHQSSVDELSAFKAAAKSLLSNEQARADLRYFKIWLFIIKRIQKRTETFHFLWYHDVGIKFPDFYVSFGLALETERRFDDADAIYKIGFCRVAENDEIKEAWKSFSQRMSMRRQREITQGVPLNMAHTPSVASSHFSTPIPHSSHRSSDQPRIPLSGILHYYQSGNQLADTIHHSFSTVPSSSIPLPHQNAFFAWLAAPPKYSLGTLLEDPTANASINPILPYNSISDNPRTPFLAAESATPKNPSSPALHATPHINAPKEPTIFYSNTASSKGCVVRKKVQAGVQFLDSKKKNVSIQEAQVRAEIQQGLRDSNGRRKFLTERSFPYVLSGALEAAPLVESSAPIENTFVGGSRDRSPSIQKKIIVKPRKDDREKENKGHHPQQGKSKTALVDEGRAANGVSSQFSRNMQFAKGDTTMLLWAKQAIEEENQNNSFYRTPCKPVNMNCSLFSTQRPTGNPNMPPLQPQIPVNARVNIIPELIEPTVSQPLPSMTPIQRRNREAAAETVPSRKKALTPEKQVSDDDFDVFEDDDTEEALDAKNISNASLGEKANSHEALRQPMSLSLTPIVIRKRVENSPLVSSKHVTTNDDFDVFQDDSSEESVENNTRGTEDLEGRIENFAVAREPRESIEPISMRSQRHTAFRLEAANPPLVSQSKGGISLIEDDEVVNDKDNDFKEGVPSHLSLIIEISSTENEPITGGFNNILGVKIEKHECYIVRANSEPIKATVTCWNPLSRRFYSEYEKRMLCSLLGYTPNSMANEINNRNLQEFLALSPAKTLFFHPIHFLPQVKNLKQGSNLPLSPLKSYRVWRKLGQGAYGSVVLATDKRNQCVAIKIQSAKLYSAVCEIYCSHRCEERYSQKKIKTLTERTYYSRWLFAKEAHISANERLLIAGGPEEARTTQSTHETDCNNSCRKDYLRDLLENREDIPWSETNVQSRRKKGEVPVYLSYIVQPTHTYTLSLLEVLNMRSQWMSKIGGSNAALWREIEKKSNGVLKISQKEKALSLINTKTSSEPLCLWMLYHISGLLSTLFSLGFIHGDVKLDNFLISVTGESTKVNRETILKGEIWGSEEDRETNGGQNRNEEAKGESVDDFVIINGIDLGRSVDVGNMKNAVWRGSSSLNVLQSPSMRRHDPWIYDSDIYGLCVCVLSAAFNTYVSTQIHCTCGENDTQCRCSFKLNKKLPSHWQHKEDFWQKLIIGKVMNFSPMSFRKPNDSSSIKEWGGSVGDVMQRDAIELLTLIRKRINSIFMEENVFQDALSLEMIVLRDIVKQHVIASS